ncbi:hypothetical protein [uncultured Helcococcus sp.]|uniref:hypothetical protein n=1 Tax=uncultured Helcococcus sp. TaxID=1072508 RepID=UPI00260F7B46|nr:hypothetical protein [uncultured Helcococcus sp.]
MKADNKKIKFFRSFDKIGGNLRILLLTIVIAFVATSCKDNATSQEDEKPKQTQNEVETNTKVEKDNLYKDRDKVSSLIDQNKIFNEEINYKIVDDEPIIYILLQNEEIELEDLDKIKVGISIKDFDDRKPTFTNFDKSKKYWELELKEGKLEGIYDINISKDSDLLDDKDKQVLMSKDKRKVLVINIFVDEGSPVKIINHILDEDSGL